MRRIGMRWLGIVVVLAYGVAHADSQLATDAPAPQLATAGRCERETQLRGHAPADVARVLKERKLRPIKLERILLPNHVQGGPSMMITVKLGGREVRGIYSNIAGDGCIRSDIRHAVDADGNLYQIDGPAGVVDYTRGRCDTGRRGWQPCNLTGVTNVLFVVPDPSAKLAGVIGSNLVFYAGL